MYPAFLDDERQIAPARAVRTQLDDGSFTLRSPMALQPYARCVGEWLERWAKETPDALALAERSDSAEGWRSLTYAQLRRQVGAVAQSLLDLRLPAGRPIAILSDNAVDHAVLMLAAMHVGITPCSLSSAYARSQDHSRLHGMLSVLEPSLVYASDASVYAPALQGWDSGAVRVFSRNVDACPGRCLGSICSPGKRHPRCSRPCRRCCPMTMPNTCSPPDPPAGPRWSSTPTACSAPTNR